MHPRLALTVGITGICLATLGNVLPATAAVVPPAPSARTAGASAATTPKVTDSSSTDDVTIRRSGSTVTLDIAAGSTQVTVADKTGRALAGSTVHEGRARVTLAAPTMSSELTVTGTVHDTVTTIGTVTLAGSDRDQVEAPSVAGSYNDGSRAGVVLSGTPGAVVKVLDHGAVVGVRVLGSSGTSTVPVAATTDTDKELEVVQAIDGQTSSETGFDISAPPRVAIDHVFTDAAVVTFSTPAGTRWPLSVTDAAGREVAGGVFDSSGTTLRTVAWTPGEPTTFTVHRGDPQNPWSSETTFTIDPGRSETTLAEPTVKFPSQNLTALHGLPGASLTVREGDSDGPVVVTGSFSMGGVFLDTAKRLRPSTTYSVSQSVGSTISTALVFTTPAD